MGGDHSHLSQTETINDCMVADYTHSNIWVVALNGLTLSISTLGAKTLVHPFALFLVPFLINISPP